MKIFSRLFAPLALVVGLCVLVPAEVQAGHGGGGGGGRGGGGGGRGGYGGGYGGGRGYGGGYGYGGFGDYGGFGYGGIGLGGGFGYGGYGYPYSDNYAQPLIFTPPNYYNMPGYVDAGPNVATQQSAYYNPADLTTATVDVRVPADAKVWFDGSLTTTTGAERSFTSPPLQAGKVYQYDVRAQWMQDGKRVEKTMGIQVGAGKRSLADFMTR